MGLFGAQKAVAWALVPGLAGGSLFGSCCACLTVSYLHSSRNTIPMRQSSCCRALTPQEMQAQEIRWVHGAVTWTLKCGHISASTVLQTLLTGKFYFSFASLHCKSKIRVILSVISARKYLGDLTRYKHEKCIFLFEPQLDKRPWDWFFKVHTTSVGSESQESLPKIKVLYETLFFYIGFYILKNSINWNDAVQPQVFLALKSHRRNDKDFLM